MKQRIMLGLLVIISVYSVIAQEAYPLIKMKEFENNKAEGHFYIRKPEEVGPQDDITGNGIKFSTNGQAYMMQADTEKMYELDMETYTLKYIHDLDFLELGAEGIDEITDTYIFCSGTWGRFKLLDKDFNMLFKIRMFDWGVRQETRSAYYDEESNILFFTDEKYKLHSIVNPGMDETQNKANYRNPEQTALMFSKDSEIDLHGLTMDKKGNLYVNGKKYYWFGLMIGNCTYQFVDTRTFLVYDGKKETFIKLDKSPDEQYESATVHPSGDIYILRYNEVTDKHILYKIENTWDMEAKKVWEAR